MRDKGEGPGLDLGSGTIREALGEMREHNVNRGNSQPLMDFQRSCPRGMDLGPLQAPWVSHTAVWYKDGKERMGLGRRQDIGAKGTIRLDVAWRQSREATDPWRLCEWTDGHLQGTPAHYLRRRGLIIPL